MKLSYFINEWKQANNSLRLGQHFCNEYIKCPWPELYYCEDTEKSISMIVEYLVTLCYYPYMPHLIGEIA